MTQLAALSSSHFFLFWAFPLLVCLALGLRFGTPGPAEPRPALRPQSALDLAALLVFLGFAASWVHLILYKEDFLAGDNDFFTMITLRGSSFAPPIWPDVGRYWPLGNQEFNLIRRLTTSPAGYHALPAVQLVIALGCVASLLRGYGLALALLLATFVMTFESVTISFFGLIYPERNVVMLLAVFLLAYDRLAGRQGIVSLALALTSAQLSLYYKEPTFILIGGIGAAQLVFHRAVERDGSRVEFARARWVDVSLVLLSLYFLLMFAVSWLPVGSTSYSGERDIGSLPAALFYLQREPLLAAMLSGFALRWVQLARGRARYCGIWDSAAIAASAYFLIFVFLGLAGEHYTAPTTFVLALSGARLLAEPLVSRRLLRTGAVLVVAACLLLVNLPASSRHILVRKAKIDSQARLVAALEDDLGAKRKPLDLLFPSVSGFWIMTLGSYLDYRGFPINHVREDGELLRNGVSLHSPLRFEENRCVPWSEIACENVRGPTRIDYIAVLPDDSLPQAEIEKLAANATRLFEFRPSEAAWERVLRAFGGAADAELQTLLYRMNPDTERRRP